MSNSTQQVLSSVSERKAEDESAQPPYARYAKKIVQEVLKLRPGENLTIEAWEHELPFAEEVKFQARKLGANVVLNLEDDDHYFQLLEEGREKVLGNVGKHEWSLLENSDAYVFFPGPADARRNSQIDAKKRKQAQAYNLLWYKRAAKAGVRGARIRTAYATPARAGVMGFDYEAWRKNVLDAIDVDYQKIQKTAKKLAFIFKHGNNVEISTQNGAKKLQMNLAGKEPHVYNGLLSSSLSYNLYSCVLNVPGNEIDIAPRASSVEGSIVFDCPIYSDSKKLEGLSWTFKKGKLVSYAAKDNLSIFKEGYEKAKGDKDKVGVLAIGLNPKLRYGYNYDFNVEGALSIGIGNHGEGDTNKTDYQALGTISNADLTVDNVKVLVGGKLQRI